MAFPEVGGVEEFIGVGCDTCSFGLVAGDLFVLCEGGEVVYLFLEDGVDCVVDLLKHVSHVFSQTALLLLALQLVHH